MERAGIDSKHYCRAILGRPGVLNTGGSRRLQPESMAGKPARAIHQREVLLHPFCAFVEPPSESFPRWPRFGRTLLPNAKIQVERQGAIAVSSPALAPSLHFHCSWCISCRFTSLFAPCLNYLDDAPPPIADPVGEVTFSDLVGLWPYFRDKNLSDPVSKKALEATHFPTAQATAKGNSPGLCEPQPTL